MTLDDYMLVPAATIQKLCILFGSMISFLLLLLIQFATGFTPNRNYVLPPSLNRVRKNSAIQAYEEKQNNFETKLLKTLPMSFGLFLPLVCDAMSDVDGIEIAELPPPYVPVFFAVSILVGAGVLTLSLGDVMEEGNNFFFNLLNLLMVSNSKK